MITQLRDKCEKCNVQAITVKSFEINSKAGKKRVTTLKCGHVLINDAESISNFDDIVFDVTDKNCKHTWNKNECTKCAAHKLYDYQITAARELERANGRFAIFDDVGLGKTLPPIAYLKFHPEALPCLWVTKSSTKFQHAREMLRILGMEQPPQVILTGKEVPLPQFKIYITSYDIFRRTGIEVWKSVNLQTIVLDECQAIKNVDATRTGLIRQIAKEVPRIIPLSATPWKNRGSELFVALNLLDPKRFGNYEYFKRHDVNWYYEGSKIKEGGLRKGFIDTIKHIAIRREWDEVHADRPDFVPAKFLTEMPDYAQKVYDEESIKITNIMNAAAIDGTDIAKQRAELQGHMMIMRQIVGIAKVPTTVELACEFLESCNRKLVIWVHHKKCAEMIYTAMQKWCAENEQPQPLMGSSSLNDFQRAELINNFNGPNYRLAILSTLAFGEGANLQTCSDSILHERQWNPANELQSVRGRFQRVGQKATQINCTYVHGKESVDMDFDAIVSKKMVEFHNSMNRGEMPVFAGEDMIMEIAQRIADRVNASKRKSK